MARDDIHLDHRGDRECQHGRVVGQLRERVGIIGQAPRRGTDAQKHLAHPRGHRHQRHRGLGDIHDLGHPADVVGHLRVLESLEREASRAGDQDIRPTIGQQLGPLHVRDAAHVAGRDIALGHAFGPIEDAEIAVAGHAIRDHATVARLNDVEWQVHARKEHEPEGEERES